MKKELIIIALAFLVLVGCGARKSDTNKKEENTKKDFSGFFRNSGNSHEILKTDLNLKLSSFSKVEDQNKKQTTKKIFTPINPNLTASVTDESGKKYDLNNASYTEENTIEDNNKKSEHSRNSQQILKTELDKKANYIQRLEAQIKEIKRLYDKNKKTEKEEWSSLNLLWLLIPLAIIALAVWLWKKYKKVNPLV